MKEELFDKKIKELVQGFEEPADGALWSSIGSELARIRRIKFIKRISAYAASAAAVVVGIWLFVNPLDRDELGASPSDLAVAEKEFVAEEVDIVTVVPVAQEHLADNLHSVKSSGVLSDVVKESSELLEESDEESVAAYDVEEQSQVQVVMDDVKSSESVLEAESVAQVDVLESEEVSSEELYGYEEYLLEEDYSRKGGSFSLSAGGNMSTVDNESSMVFFPGPSFNVGGGQGVVENHSITPTAPPNHYFPISAGLNLTYSFLNDKMAVGLGLNYSYLYSKYEALVDRRYDANVKQSVHYIGVPLNLYYNIVGNEYITFYASLGGMMERALKIDYDVTTLSGEKMDRYITPKGFQWSVNVGVGFEYRFVKFMGIYVDPRLTYYFQEKSQPFTVRSEQPLQFNLEIGFRFHL
ncbi:MAG: hypothetical protein J6U51_00140 [Bacteroidales bacterium]|nr:hypothetical protein [Bacteroidales bacterium]